MIIEPNSNLTKPENTILAYELVYGTRQDIRNERYVMPKLNFPNFSHLPLTDSNKCLTRPESYIIRKLTYAENGLWPQKYLRDHIGESNMPFELPSWFVHHETFRNVREAMELYENEILKSRWSGKRSLLKRAKQLIERADTRGLYKFYKDLYEALLPSTTVVVGDASALVHEWVRKENEHGMDAKWHEINKELCSIYDSFISAEKSVSEVSTVA